MRSLYNWFEWRPFLANYILTYWPIWLVGLNGTNSATSRLGEGVEMSKQLSQQTGQSYSSSYGLVYIWITNLKCKCKYTPIQIKTCQPLCGVRCEGFPGQAQLIYVEPETGWVMFWLLAVWMCDVWVEYQKTNPKINMFIFCKMYEMSSRGEIASNIIFIDHVTFWEYCSYNYSTCPPSRGVRCKRHLSSWPLLYL